MPTFPETCNKGKKTPLSHYVKLDWQEVHLKKIKINYVRIKDKNYGNWLKPKTASKATTMVTLQLPNTGIKQQFRNSFHLRKLKCIPK